MHTFYNISDSVGPRKANQMDDVMLVQLCLNQIYGPNTLSVYVPEGSPIAVDGKFGPFTHNSIWDFQTQMEYNGVNIYPDGVVNQLPDFWGVTLHEYSILWLNWCLLQVIGEKRFANLPHERITPRVLGVKLSLTDI